LANSWRCSYIYTPSQIEKGNGVLKKLGAAKATPGDATRCDDDGAVRDVTVRDIIIGPASSLVKITSTLTMDQRWFLFRPKFGRNPANAGVFVVLLPKMNSASSHRTRHYQYQQHSYVLHVTNTNNSYER
jgi:hypothetical protein